jgi:hypothetical protein
MRVFSPSSRLRFWLACALAVVVPNVMLGQTPVAVLHAQGGVWVNGYEARDASSVFDGDQLETKPGFSANLNLDGSEILIQEQSVTKFQKDVLALDHGGVSVGTSTQYKVKVNCITVIPVNPAWTQYSVTDVDGKVVVAAAKNDVRVEAELKKTPSPQTEATKNNNVVHEGEQAKYQETEVCGAPPGPASPGSFPNVKWIAIGGGVATVVALCLAWFCKSSPKPISPDSP